MKRHRIPSFVVPLALLAAGAAAGGEPPACSEIEVGGSSLIFADGFESGDTSAWQTETGEGASGPRFSATRIIDLDFVVHFSAGLTGDHVLHLRLLTPQGHHYQTISAPITSNPTKRGSLVRIEGYPRPLPVRPARPLSGHDTARRNAAVTAVALGLPVGGTAIVSSALYGRWTAEAYLDEATTVCASAPFVLQP